MVDKSLIKGVVVPILTPIDENERIDEAKLRSQVDYVIEGGVLGILAFGSNGEFYMVEEDEMERGLEIMISQTNGRVPVYFGIGAISTRKCVRLAKMAVEKGAYGISVLQPMFLKPTEEELFLHFKTIADAVPSTPMLLYNNPGRVGYTMSAKLVERLAHEKILFFTLPFVMVQWVEYVLQPTLCLILLQISTTSLLPVTIRDPWRLSSSLIL